MNCPCCGAAELIHDTRHTPYIYKGDATTIPAMKGDFCPAYGVVVLNKEQGDRYGEFIRQTALPLFELGFTLERSQPDEQVREILLS